MNPCSVSVIYYRHERFRKGRKSSEDDSRDRQPCIMKMTSKDKAKNIIYTDHKNVNQTWCFEATEFIFTENDAL